MKKVAMILSGRTLMVTEDVARTAMAKQAKIDAVWAQSVEAKRTVAYLGSPRNQLSGWVPTVRSSAVPARRPVFYNNKPVEAAPESQHLYTRFCGVLISKEAV